MSWGVYGLIIVFGLFIVLLIINPNLSCFGKRIKAPFYPLVRKRRLREKQSGTKGEGAKPAKPTEDYGFKLDK